MTERKLSFGKVAQIQTSVPQTFTPAGPQAVAPAVDGADDRAHGSFGKVGIVMHFKSSCLIDCGLPENQ